VQSHGIAVGAKVLVQSCWCMQSVVRCSVWTGSGIRRTVQFEPTQATGVSTPASAGFTLHCNRSQRRCIPQSPWPVLLLALPSTVVPSPHPIRLSNRRRTMGKERRHKGKDCLRFRSLWHPAIVRGQPLDLSRRVLLLPSQKSLPTLLVTNGVAGQPIV
jgi:hypothetical protein